MRIRKLLLLIFFIPIAMFASYFELEVDALYLGRDLTASNNIMEYDRNPHTGVFQQKLTTKDVAQEMGHDVGIRARGAIYPNRKEGLEFRYTGLISFRGERNKASINELTFPFKKVITYDWAEADRGKAIYTNDFYSFDVSYVNYIIPRFVRYFTLNWGVGFNYAEIKEQFKLRYYKDYRSSKYDIKTKNTLFGGHVLGEFAANPYRSLTWGIQARFGIDANVIGSDSDLYDNNDTIPMMIRRQHKLVASYYGELDPYIDFMPVPVFNIFIGYSWIYYRDIAQATEQLNYTPSQGQSIDHRGHENYRGFYAGIGFRF